MNKLGKTCVAVLAFMFASEPAIVQSAWACASREDEFALEAANVQQRLMVAALTCHDVNSYNRFVMTFRRDLQDSDAVLMAFFRKGASGTAGYHAYKTRLANTSALESVRNDDFCRDAHTAFRTVLYDYRDTLAEALARLPQTDTGFDACYRREARDDRSRGGNDNDADDAPPAKDWRW